MFFKKKINSEEFEALHKKIILSAGDIDLLKTEIANLKTNMNSLRGLINRKGSAKLEESEDLNNSVLLTNNGTPVSDFKRIGLS